MCGRNAIGIRRRRTSPRCVKVGHLVCCLLLLAILVGPERLLAQHPRSNVELLGDLAVGCVGPVADSLSSFLLQPSNEMPYLRPRLTAYWRGQNKQVFLADSAEASTLSAGHFKLTYDPEEALVEYEGADGDQLKRVVTLAIRHSLVAPSGLLLDDRRCRDQRTDLIGRQQVPIVERDPFPETRGVVPTKGNWRDWGEPVLLAASVGLVAYLFFSIRSS